MSETKTIKKASNADKVRGKKNITKEIDEFKYDSPDVNYQVTNYKNNERKATVTGREIDAFIGLDNNAREALKNGEKEVIIYNKYTEEKEKMYKIEVIG